MTALADINAALDKAKADRAGAPLFKRRSLLIQVGDSAASAIMAETTDNELPAMIGGVRVVPTTAFRGWHIDGAEEKA